MKIKLKQKSILWTILVLIFSPFFSQASAYWMEITGSGKTGEKVIVKLIYGNIDGFGIRHRRILGINNTHPVVDRSASGGENGLPIDYLCSQYIVGSAQGKLGLLQFLDITIRKEGKVIKVAAFHDNLAAKRKTKLRVFNPENWEKELVLDENGTAVFSATMKGMYIIRLDWTEPKGGATAELLIPACATGVIIPYLWNRSYVKLFRLIINNVFIFARIIQTSL
jgi:hypothetical protein